MCIMHIMRKSTVLVHSSLSSLGWVCGGPVAVVRALQAALGPAGTLAMPSFSSDLSDPANWLRPPVPASWWPLFRSSAPAFDAAVTPTRGVGVVPECFRKFPGVVRSPHPTSSFCALGPAAASLASAHALSPSLGEGSPLARLYENGAYVLLLGVGHDRNTSLHLAEGRAGVCGSVREGSPVLDGQGRRQWVGYDDLDYCSDDFARLGEAFAATGAVRVGTVGAARALLMSQRELVDYGVQWLAQNRAGAASS
eukprot:m51a1_g12428 putative aminoglycoside n(3 )-acetyltransferase (253) ;mRNA; f:799259-811251